MSRLPDDIAAAVAVGPRVRRATITAIDAAGPPPDVTLAWATGGSTPGVSCLHGFSPSVGLSVRVFIDTDGSCLVLG